jgi:hypothetical protein
MRSLCRWLIAMSALACISGCCKSPELLADQTPVVVTKAQRVQVRPIKGGAPRTVTVPVGFVVVDPPPPPPELPR